MRVVVTGAAGFIGAAVAERLLARGDPVVGIDNLSNYYDPGLKRARLDRLLRHDDFRFERIDIVDGDALRDAFADERPHRAVHLAAQAGVRHSIDHPRAYVDANVVGFLNVLEAARAHRVEHLVYASTSAVYGGNARLPFSTEDKADRPLSIYAASKSANALMAHAYGHLFAIPATGLRFFTAYGPWDRPDMALSSFTRNILAGEPIDVFNHGNHRRDFTYIDDIAECVVRVLDRAPSVVGEGAPHRVYNVGGHRPVPLLRFIELLERNLGQRAKMRFLPMQPGDVPDTDADIESFARDFGYRPATSIETGIARFAAWHRQYYAP